VSATESSPWELLELMSERGWSVAVLADRDVDGNGSGLIAIEAERDGIPIRATGRTVMEAAPDLYQQAQRVAFAGV
jgi:hypothetical protein